MLSPPMPLPASEPPLAVAARRASRAIGALFFSLFGGAWLVLWSFRARPEGGTVRVVLIALSVLGAAAIFRLALRQYRRHRDALAAGAESPAKRRTDRLFHLVNGGQWLLILIVGNVLANVGRSAWVLPAAILIIGLHFLPLAAIFANPAHHVTGSVLVALALAYPFLATGGPRDPIGCLGAGLILWGSALWAVVDHPSTAEAP